MEQKEAKRLLAKHLGNVPSLVHCPNANIYIYKKNIRKYTARICLERFLNNKLRQDDDVSDAMAI
jgi:hypothetical protein